VTDPSDTPAASPLADVPATADARLRVFAYAVADKADVYLAIIDAMAAATERFRLQQRPREIRRDLADAGLLLEEAELSAALDQLWSWGNLARLFDPTSAETLSEFYGRRYLYQVTAVGVAAHEGVQRVRAVGLDAGGRLSRVLLPRVHERLEAVSRAVADDDPGRLYASLLDLFATCAELASNAGRYMNDLAVETSTVAADDASFSGYKHAVLAYLDEFVAGMADWVPRIDALLRDLAPAAPHFLAVAATVDAAPTADGTIDDGPLDSLRQRWRGVHDWFVGSADDPPVAAHLRSAMLEAINRILFAVERLQERTLRRVSREADLMTLAGWFAAEPDDPDSLWDVAFGLYSARHFVNHAGDELYDHRRSLWEAEPAEIAPRLRTVGTRAAPGRPGNRADYSLAKAERLAAVRRAEAQARAVTDGLADRTPALLSDLGKLDVGDLDRLLELIDAALAARPAASGERRASLPGVEVLLRPVAGGARAFLVTPSGTLDCPDHELELRLLTPTPAPALQQASP